MHLSAKVYVVHSDFRDIFSNSGAWVGVGVWVWVSRMCVCVGGGGHIRISWYS